MCQLIYSRIFLFNNLKIKALFIKIAAYFDNSLFLQRFIWDPAAIKQQSQQMG